MAESEFSIVERRDEEQIIAELKGQVIKEYFYESKGKTIISYTGVKEISREYGNNEADLVDMRETDDAWIVVCKATDTERKITRLGASTQSKIDRFSGNPDEFCFQKAFSKAQRNALKTILPVTIITKAIEAWKAQKGGSTSKTNAQPRRNADATFNVMDYMKDKELKAPEWVLKDELNRAEESWEDAVNITEAWLGETGFKPDVFKVSVNDTRIVVKAKKAFPMEVKAMVSSIMVEAGFTQTKNLWRLQKKDVTG